MDELAKSIMPEQYKKLTDPTDIGLICYDPLCTIYSVHKTILKKSKLFSKIFEGTPKDVSFGNITTLRDNNREVIANSDLPLWCRIIYKSCFPIHKCNRPKIQCISPNSEV